MVVEGGHSDSDNDRHENSVGAGSVTRGANVASRFRALPPAVERTKLASSTTDAATTHKHRGPRVHRHQSGRKSGGALLD